MVDENKQRGNIFSANDTLDINELASLNDDISPEFIEQLQNQVAQNASDFIGKPLENIVDDSNLFEEVKPEIEPKTVVKNNINEDIDDNYIKKYKARIDKQEKNLSETSEENSQHKISQEEAEKDQEKVVINNNVDSSTLQPEGQDEIGNLTSGNIVEKPATQEQIDYNESLDFLDDNVKYSKYVIYVDPENTEFIESLTVKERKNLINRLLREQDDIAITKKRLSIVQTVIKHTIIAIITVSIAIPVVYWTINASLEASINNYKRSKTIFKTLYREKGKIKKQINY